MSVIFNFADSDNPGFTFVSTDSDNLTFSFADSDNSSFSFVLDSEEPTIDFIEVGPNQTINQTTTQNITQVIGLDSDSNLITGILNNLDSDSGEIQRLSGEVADLDSVKLEATSAEIVKINARLDSDELVIQDLRTSGVGGGVGGTDSEEVIKIINANVITGDQLENYVPSGGVQQVVTFSSTGTAFNTISGGNEKIEITFDSDYDATPKTIAGGTVCTVSGYTSETAANGTYTLQTSTQWGYDNGQSRAATNLSYSNNWYRKDTGDYSLIRWDGPSGAFALWTFIAVDLTGQTSPYSIAKVDGHIFNVYPDTGDSINETNVDRYPGFGASISPGLTFSTAAGAGGKDKVKYTFDLGAAFNDSEVVINMDSDSRAEEARDQIAAALTGVEGFTVTKGSDSEGRQVVFIDTGLDSDIADISITTENADDATAVAFDGTSETKIEVFDGVTGDPASQVTIDGKTFIQPSAASQIHFYGELVDDPYFTNRGYTFTYDSDTPNQIVATYTTAANNVVAPSVSVSHFGGNGTFTWDSDAGTITTDGQLPGAQGRAFFDLIYDSDYTTRHIEEAHKSGAINMDHLLIINTDSDNPDPTLSDFTNGAIFFGQY